MFAQLKVLAPLFLPRVGMCAPPQRNESFDSGFAHSFLSGKSNGVTPLNVMRQIVGGVKMNYRRDHIVIFLLCLTFCTNTMSVSVAQEKPPIPFISKRVCPFECCQFGRWLARSPLRVYETEGDTSKVIFNIAIGDTFHAVTGNVRIDKLGVVVVTKPIESFQAGDTLYTLTYRGEGFMTIWYKGKVRSVEMFWDYDDEADWGNINPFDPKWSEFPGVLIDKPLMIWWVNVVLPNGQTGWLKLVNNTVGGFAIDEEIDGMDGCG